MGSNSFPLFQSVSLYCVSTHISLDFLMPELFLRWKILGKQLNSSFFLTVTLRTCLSWVAQMTYRCVTGLWETCGKLGMVAHARDSNVLEIIAGGPLSAQGQPVLHSKF